METAELRDWRKKLLLSPYRREDNQNIIEKRYEIDMGMNKAANISVREQIERINCGI